MPEGTLRNMLLDITVSDPETHVGTKTSLSFVDFKVATVTDDSRYAAHDFFVRRRYRDFVWLRSQLTQAYPGAIVPPLPPPDKPYKGELNRFDSNFIARRQAGLELFLRRVAAHNRLSGSADLLTFLEAKVWELQTAKNASSSSWVSSVLDSTDASMKRVASALRTTKTPDDDEVEKLRAFANEYHSVVSATETAHQTTVASLAEAASDLSHLGPAFDLLSQSERELSLPFTHMAKTLDAMRELFLKQVQTEHVSGLTALLAFNSGNASSLKDVLKNRDHALTQYNKATALLDARTKETQRWQTSQDARRSSGSSSSAPDTESSSGMMGSLMTRFNHMVDDPHKGTKLQGKVAEAERALEETKAKWDDISASISTEAAAFHARTNYDFSRGLREHVHEQLEFEAAQQKYWKELLAVFEQVLHPNPIRTRPIPDDTKPHPRPPNTGPILTRRLTAALFPNRLAV